MLHLEEFSTINLDKLYKFLHELPSESGFENEYFEMSKEEFLKKAPLERKNSSAGINLKKGYVPDTYFFLFDGQDMVGLFKLRHHLNDSLRSGAGHIGYAIHPNYRHLGYGTEGLKLAIEKLKPLMPIDEKEVYLSCNRDNLNSLQVQLNNRAYIHHQDEKHFYTRIKLN